MIGKEMSLKILGAREDPMLIAQVSERTPFVGGGLDCRMPHSATRFNYKILELSRRQGHHSKGLPLGRQHFVC